MVLTPAGGSTLVIDKDVAATLANRELEPLRDVEGHIRSGYVERVAAAIAARDAAALKLLVGSLHEADAGDLIAALDPDLRPKLIKLMGADFDFRWESYEPEGGVGVRRNGWDCDKRQQNPAAGTKLVPDMRQLESTRSSSASKFARG